MKNLLIISSLLLACSVSVEGGGASDTGGSGGTGGSTSSNPTGSGVDLRCDELCTIVDECLDTELEDCLTSCLNDYDPACQAEAAASNACQIEMFASCDPNAIDYHACDLEFDAYRACTEGLTNCATEACANAASTECACEGACGAKTIEQRCSLDNVAGGSPEGMTACECWVDGVFTGNTCSQLPSQCSIEGGCCKYALEHLD